MVVSSEQAILVLISGRRCNTIDAVIYICPLYVRACSVSSAIARSLYPVVSAIDSVLYCRASEMGRTHASIAARASLGCQGDIRFAERPTGPTTH